MEEAQATPERDARQDSEHENKMKEATKKLHLTNVYQ
jgi:hypothetical protein